MNPGDLCSLCSVPQKKMSCSKGLVENSQRYFVSCICLTGSWRESVVLRQFAESTRSEGGEGARSTSGK